jgi:DNA replication protein DnaD
MQGWIKLHRKIRHHYLFQEERVFSKFEAWVDLMMMVNHKVDKVMINSTWVQVKRGQRLTSMKKLAEQWRWSRGKVKKYLDLLKADGMISYEVTTKYIIITLLNYEFYQKSESSVDIKPNNRSTTKKHQNDTNKNDLRMDKNGKDLLPPTLIRRGRYDEN